MLELRPKKPYPTGRASKFLVGGKSASFQEAPMLAPYLFNAAAYDLVVLGTPLWAWNIAPPLRTFLRENDLSHAKLAAFVCCGGGNPKNAFASVSALVGNKPLAARMTIVNALADKDAAAERIEAFCHSLQETP